MIEYRKRITRQMLRDEPEKLFVFGDNLERARERLEEIAKSDGGGR